MSFFKVKLRKTDRLWTKHIRTRDKYTCQKCEKTYPTESCRNLGVSHYWGRGRENTRFDEDNCIALCTLPCHQNWGGEGRQEYTDFMKQRLGEKGFADLELRAHMRKKRDDITDELYIKELLGGEQ